MPNITFSKFDILLSKASDEFLRNVVEADIRGAHGEAVARSSLSGVPQYVYDALVCNLDKDQKAWDAELDDLAREDRG